ncbi:DUF4175 family protein [Chitinophaga sp. Cy-1792]|uniref:DUF4175 family protein n=1 Tax=Chitinophaga sp. Cy-1792 TaxID=2608339 RepID=UPI00141D770E|nr:DUF4175 family protein [Chitinophaga sp. Cy-1792]NIG54197.1 DUF4175 domain-containing protein [Chitinophaga sp. Cy-1792]
MYNPILLRIRKQWIALRISTILLQAVAVGVLGYFLLGRGGIIAGLVYAAVFLLNFYRHVPGLTEIATYLNQQFPELEDSAGLCLRDTAELTLPEKMQLAKMTPLLAQLKLPRRFYRAIPATIGCWLIVAGLCFVVGIRGNHLPKAEINKVTTTEKIPGTNGVEISIQPPAYTRLPSRQQQQYDLLVPDSTMVTWKITTTHAPATVTLLFSDSTRIMMTPDTDSSHWTASRCITHQGFYQVQLDTLLSAYYQLQIIPDHPPLIKVVQPQPNTSIAFGQKPVLQINTVITDDYGISKAGINGTIASGSGEAVKFREVNLTFGESLNGQPASFNGSRQLDLSSLGMKSGDELYFSITATDTRNQQTLSDVMIVTLPDTAALFSMEGLANAVNIKPEYFRSQRQIIIETEALISAKDSLGTTRFNTRSNDLAADQKILRLRYGKFLGEEAESNIGDSRVGDDHDHDGHEHHEAESAADFGNAAKIIDAYTDKHDNAEDATFFDPEIKQQLKATLNEMWKAELQLRLYKPQEALPYEYKALRLLKDLQQKSRAFVPKTGVKTTPLKPEKRLAGDQDKINPAIIKQVLKRDDPNITIRVAIAVLDNVGAQTKMNDTALQVLRQALLKLNAAAAAEPAKYLRSMQALQQIIKGDITAAHIRAAQQSLVQLLPPEILPQPDVSSFNRLQEIYLRQLKNSHIR